MMMKTVVKMALKTLTVVMMMMVVSDDNEMTIMMMCKTVPVACSPAGRYIAPVQPLLV